MQPPLIGITTRSLSSYEDAPDTIPAGHFTGDAYVRAISRSGGIPCLIPLLDDASRTLASLFGRLDGLLLPGGSDIRPAEYGAHLHSTLDRGDPGRDRVERLMVQWAVKRRLPLLGICRGTQVINVSLGGTLFQHVADQVPGAEKHDYFPEQGHARDILVHEARLSPGTRVRELVGAAQLRVNSLHHQAVSRLGHGLVATGFAPDGIVEALELPDHPFCVGVQWHPEELLDADARMAGIFDGLVEAAARAKRSDTGSNHLTVAAAG